MADAMVQLLATAFSEIAERLAMLAEDASLLDGALELRATQSIAETPLDSLATRLQLTSLEIGLLLCAIAPTMDSRFGALLAELDPGEQRRAPRVDVAARLAGGSLWDPDTRTSMSSGGALSRSHLWQVVGSGPMPERVLIVDDRVVEHLLGSTRPNAQLDALQAPTAMVDVPEVHQIASLLLSGAWAVWLRDPGGHLGISVAATALAALGSDVIAVDLALLAPGRSLADVLPIALREATLRTAGLVVGNVDLTRDGEAMSNLGDPVCPIVLVGADAWNPNSSTLEPALVDQRPLPLDTRRDLWRRLADDAGAMLTADELVDLAALRLGPGQISRAVRMAVPMALGNEQPLGETHLRRAALANGAGRLDRLSTHVVPRATVDDLVLPQDLMAELLAIPGWMRTRHRVRTEWGMDRGARRSQGITCLFAGPSGTGKTLAAEVVASSLGVDLYVIDLSQIVDKYIGETEKNLDRVFSEAEGVNGVLLFDEADALFGKRTDVKSSHDRNANLEVAYLLQRMERYDGVAVLTTNLRNNIDDAFTRRIDMLCAFPEPDVALRHALWRRHLPDTVPLDADVDLDFLAEHLVITGGVIRNVAVAAAHSAAIAGHDVCLRDLVVAASREFRKQARLFSSPALAAILEASP